MANANHGHTHSGHTTPALVQPFQLTFLGFRLLRRLFLFMSGFGDVVTRLDFGVAVQLLLRHYVTHEVLGHTVCGNKKNRLMLTSLTDSQDFPVAEAQHVVAKRKALPISHSASPCPSVCLLVLTYSYTVLVCQSVCTFVAYLAVCPSAYMC